jgi:hypothetical protein
MFHVANNLFFDRTAAGSVRILKLSRPPEQWPQSGYWFPEDTLLDVTISAEQWFVLVAALNMQDPEASRYYEMFDFHKPRPT